MNMTDWRCTEQTPTTCPRYRCDLPAGHHGDHFRVGFGAWFGNQCTNTHVDWMAQLRESSPAFKPREETAS